MRFQLMVIDETEDGTAAAANGSANFVETKECLIGNLHGSQFKEPSMQELAQ